MLLALIQNINHKLATSEHGIEGAQRMVQTDQDQGWVQRQRGQRADRDPVELLRILGRHYSYPTGKVPHRLAKARFINWHESPHPFQSPCPLHVSQHYTPPGLSSATPRSVRRGVAARIGRHYGVAVGWAAAPSPGVLIAMRACCSACWTRCCIVWLSWFRMSSPLLPCS